MEAFLQRFILFACCSCCTRALVVYTALRIIPHKNLNHAMSRCRFKVHGRLMNDDTTRPNKVWFIIKCITERERERERERENIQYKFGDLYKSLLCLTVQHNCEKCGSLWKCLMLLLRCVRQHCYTHKHDSIAIRTSTTSVYSTAQSACFPLLYIYNKILSIHSYFLRRLQYAVPKMLYDAWHIHAVA